MRKTKSVRITGDKNNRDVENGFVFLIKEMPAWQAEKWAIKAFLALARAGVELPDDITTAGMAALPAVIMMVGLKGLAGLNYFDAEPLLDEMMGCVRVQPKEDAPEITRDLRADDIEEISTFLKLRAEILSLHYDFSQAVTRSTSKEPGVTANGSPIPTSPEASAP